MVIMTFTFSRSFSQPEGLDLRWEECYEDIYWFFGVVVWKLFMNFSHLTISNLFELSEVLSFYYIKNKK